MPSGTLSEMRRLADLLDRADELTEKGIEEVQALRDEASYVAAWIRDVRGDSCRMEAARLRAEFADGAAELWPLLLSYAEAWAAAGSRWAA
jgi:hypothetical protein